MATVTPAAAAERVCDKLQFILATVWIVEFVALIFVDVYFTFLFCVPGEPRVRKTQWAGRWHSNIYVSRTEEAPDWWTTSISEYAAARGSTGSKLLASAMSVCGALQIAEASLLHQVCVMSAPARTLLWVGGIGAIVLGQMESSDEYDDPPHILRLKKVYAVIHAVGALAFVLLSTAGVVMTAEGPTWVAGGLSILGCVLFFLAVLFQQFAGNYVEHPETCLFPQKPEYRAPGLNKRFGWCHAWLASPGHRIALSRLVLFSELAGTSLVILAVCYLSMYHTFSNSFCTQLRYERCFLGTG